MQENNSEKVFDAGICPVRQVLDRLGDKWTILVIVRLGASGPLRFNEISRRVGDISQKMLTVTLRSLEADGLVSRTQYPEIPPRVEYVLTPMGFSLLPHIEDLAIWAEKNLDSILHHRRQYEQRSKGSPANLRN